jgi:hypothetical protein
MAREKRLDRDGPRGVAAVRAAVVRVRRVVSFMVWGVWLVVVVVGLVGECKGETSRLVWVTLLWIRRIRGREVQGYLCLGQERNVGRGC